MPSSLPDGYDVRDSNDYPRFNQQRLRGLRLSDDLAERAASVQRQRDQRHKHRAYRFLRILGSIQLFSVSVFAPVGKFYRWLLFIHSQHVVARSNVLLPKEKDDVTPVKTLGMDDVGTRIEHLSDLHELWSFAFGLLTTQGIWHTAVEQAQAEELEIGLKLLTKHMQSNYDSRRYAQEINSLPRSIPDPTGE